MVELNSNKRFYGLAIMGWNTIRAARKFGLLSALCCLLAACAASRPENAAPSFRLIIGYAREPDTMNRFSTHILEDIHSCIIEGLTTTDENMNTVPVLAEVVPSIENGLVQLR